MVQFGQFGVFPKLEFIGIVGQFTVCHWLESVRFGKVWPNRK